MCPFGLRVSTELSCAVLQEVFALLIGFEDDHKGVLFNGAFLHELSSSFLEVVVQFFTTDLPADGLVASIILAHLQHSLQIL